MGRVNLVNISKRFGRVTAVDGLTLEIADREFMVLLGPSGCGKTTTLNMIAGLEEPSGGELLIDGEDVRYVLPHRRNIAMVFQSYALYPHMTAFKNIAFPLRMSGVPRPEVERRVGDAARTLGIEALLDRRPRELSGGERQRVALGRAIVREPGAFLMDEPLSNLDAALRVEMRGELKKLHRRLGTTFIYVTHDQAEALTLADRVAVMHRGVLQQVGSPHEIYARPANLFVARFIGSPPMNLLRGHLQSANGRLVFETTGVRVPVDPGSAEALEAHAGAAVVLGVRPEHIRLQAAAAEGPAFAGEVVLQEPLGADLFVEVAVGDLALKVRTAPEMAEQLRGRVTGSFAPGTCLLFDAGSERRLG